MIPPVLGWSRRTSGDSLILESALGRIVYLDELAPIVPFAQLSEMPAERFVTDEGEHGAIAGMLAVVVGDRHYARLDATPAFGVEAELAASLRTMAARVIFGLGLRRRRVWYPPPAGWLGVPRGMSTDWIAPFSRATRMRVYPATPARISPEEVLRALLDETPEARLVDSVPLAHGVRAETRAGAVWRDWALQRVGDYQYTVKLEAPTAETRAQAQPAFLALVASLEWVPGRRSAISHWAE